MKKFTIVMSVVLIAIMLFAGCRQQNMNEDTTAGTQSTSTTVKAEKSTESESEITSEKSTATSSKESSTSATVKASTTAKQNTTKATVKTTAKATTKSTTKTTTKATTKATTKKQTTTKSTTTTSKQIWCWEGGSKHVIPEGIGWYSSYNEAKKAGLAYIGNSGSSGSWEVQECDCGKFTVYVKID